MDKKQQSAERVKRWRKRLKMDNTKFKAYVRKEAQRKINTWKKEKEYLNRNKEACMEKREKDRERQKSYRERKKKEKIKLELWAEVDGVF